MSCRRTRTGASRASTWVVSESDRGPANERARRSKPLVSAIFHSSSLKCASTSSTSCWTRAPPPRSRPTTSGSPTTAPHFAGSSLPPPSHPALTPAKALAHRPPLRLPHLAHLPPPLLLPPSPLSRLVLPHHKRRNDPRANKLERSGGNGGTAPVSDHDASQGTAAG